MPKGDPEGVESVPDSTDRAASPDRGARRGAQALAAQDAEAPSNGPNWPRR